MRGAESNLRPYRDRMFGPSEEETVRHVANDASWRLLALDLSNATRYYFVMTIVSFKCKDTEALFAGKRVRRWVSVERPALQKLEQLDWSSVLEDLRAPPGNRPEALKGNRKGQHSIRINGQWRVCFVWTASGAKDVEIVDYH